VGGGRQLIPQLLQNGIPLVSVVMVRRPGDNAGRFSHKIAAPFYKYYAYIIRYFPEKVNSFFSQTIRLHTISVPTEERFEKVTSNFVETDILFEKKSVSVIPKMMLLCYYNHKVTTLRRNAL
jgi:hypothetical protein